MLTRDIIPVEGASNSSGVLRYSSGERGDASGRKNRQDGRKESREEEKTTQRQPQRKTTEFESLLMNMMEGNRRMRETARTVAGARPGINANAFSVYRSGLVIRQN
jgi:hypothetical protein